EYFVYVRSRCGTTPGIWTTFPVSFMTLCDVVSNFYENFDSTIAGTTTNPSPPTCWTYLDDMTSTGYGYTYNLATYAKSGTQSFRFYMYNAVANNNQYLYLISPETDNLGNGTKQIRFSVMMGSATVPGRLEVVRLSDISSPAAATASATVIETFDLSNASHQEYIAYPPATTDDYFAFRVTYNGIASNNYPSFYIDDVYYEDVPPLVVNVDKTDILCHGTDSGEAVAIVEGGKPPYSYSWSPSNDTIASVTDLVPGTHTVTVTDDRNTTTTATITILEPTAIVSGLDYTDVICNGQNNNTASVTPTGGTPPYTVLWSDSTVGLTNSNLAPGNYDVTIRDANHCILTESFTIDEPDALVASVGNQTNVSTYGGNDGAATVAVTGGSSPYTYTWTPAVSTTDTASSLTAGTYTVVVTDANGCTNSEVFVITEPAPPYVITLVSKEDVSCNGGNNGSITISVTGPNPPFTYSWSPSGGNGTTASNLTAGTYTVTVTDAVNEIVTEDFIITEPGVMSASVGSIVNVSCGGNNDGSATVSVLGGTTPYNYTWSNGETTATAVSLTAGNHYVLVTDANGCQVQQSFSIGQPTPIVINTVNITDASCHGQADGSITISVNGGLTPYTYSWSNNQTGTSLSNLTGGTYTVTVTDANGCTEQKTFTVVDPAVVYPPSAVNQGFCSDTTPLLSDVVITGTNIQWYDAATGGNLLPFTTALTNGATYYASQTVDGCESSSRTSVQISLYQSVPLTTTNKSVCYNSIIQDVTIDGFNYMQLKWYGSATSPVALSPTTLLSSGTYYVSSFTNGVCESARQAVQVTVSQGVPAPVVTPQQVCGSGHTLNDLTVGTASGATLIWYASAQTATPLSGTTQALSGTYYVEQVIGTCKSVRVAVPVQVIPVTAPSMTDLTACSGTTIADFNAQIAPAKYVWYINNTTTTALPETTLISSGTFYIAEEVSGCISNRAQVDVVVNQRPNQPTGQTVQRVSAGATVADLQMNQPGVIWFGSEADALAFTKQLPSNTPLVHNKKYYGVLVGGNNCASLPTEVEVRITLSTNDLDLTYLKYYPNPTDSELNISYVEAITKVEIFNIAGQRVLSKEFDANEVKVDLSGFGSGTYMVRIETETASQFVKVVKK
ncbi:MAG TPA: T9SS type A sorting domain-containing protein, partial [Flavobacterium sp.]|nr:T9SS type A sorting domain-containing protein [Flavobacterium sp.]